MDSYKDSLDNDSIGKIMKMIIQKSWKMSKKKCLRVWKCRENARTWVKPQQACILQDRSISNYGLFTRTLAFNL